MSKQHLEVQPPFGPYGELTVTVRLGPKQRAKLLRLVEQFNQERASSAVSLLDLETYVNLLVVTALNAEQEPNE